MQPAASAGVEATVTGTFRSIEEAERALQALRALGLPPDRVVMNSEVGIRTSDHAAGGESEDQDHSPSGQNSKLKATPLSNAKGQNSNVGGGAATGATLGGLVGIIWGWASGASVATVPGAVASVSSGILTSTITGLAIGAAVGGLVGALVGVGMPALEPPVDESGQERTVVTVQASGDIAGQARDTLISHGAVDVQPNVELSDGYQESDDRDSELATLESSEQTIPDTGDPTPDTKPLVSGSSPAGFRTSRSAFRIPKREVIRMASGDGDETSGRDPEAVTGTKDAIDPETGALGTAGTPVTAGYGVSGSTIGTGSARGQGEEESGDFKGSLPDTNAYDKGGRGSADISDTSKSNDTPVEARNVDVRLDEAPVQSEPETRDIYEQGSSYETPTETTTSDETASNRPDARTTNEEVPEKGE